MSRTITVAAAQSGPVLTDDPAEGVEAARAMVQDAAAKGADIICFGELFLSPFFPNRLTPDFDRYFMTLPNEVTAPLFETAREQGIAMVFPYGERDGSHYYNSTLVVDGRGRHLGTYRKTHIPAIFPSNLEGGTGSYEKFYFSPGNDLPVFDVAGVRVGVLICYDRKFPEAARLLAMKGAEIIFMPICAATYGEQKLRVDTWALPLQARAYENGVFVVAPNRVGNENGRQHMGQSMIINPIGAEIVALAGTEEPQLLTATLDLEDVERAQKSLPWWRDRRPELYAELAAR